MYFYIRLLKRIKHIIGKELIIERRERLSFLSSVLYLVAISFVVFKLFPDLKGPAKMGIFWILVLFTAILMVGDSFSNMSIKRKLNYYQLYNPIEVVIGKLIFNFVKLCIAATLLVLVFYILGNAPLKDPILFTKVALLTLLGMTGILTMVSSLSSYSSNQSGLVSIMSIPLLLPILLIAMRVSLISEKMFFDTAVNSNLLMLLGIDLLIVSMIIGFVSVTWKP